VSFEHALTYGERLRIRQPGDRSFTLGPHVDGGSIERFEDPLSRQAYKEVFEGRWEQYDAGSSTTPSGRPVGGQRNAPRRRQAQRAGDSGSHLPRLARGVGHAGAPARRHPARAAPAAGVHRLPAAAPAHARRRGSRLLRRDPRQVPRSASEVARAAFARDDVAAGDGGG
jgi:hypothetical protein